MREEAASSGRVLVVETPTTGYRRPFTMMDRTQLDGYDVPIVPAARRARIAAVVTHDADFATLEKFVVVTANPRMLAS